MKLFFLTLLLISSLSFGTEIHMFGDSILDSNGRGVRNELQKLTGQSIADHSRGGTWMGTIRDSYLQNRDDDLRIVVMDGGGNDMMGSDCRNFSARCKQAMDNVIQIVTDLLPVLKEDGIEQFIFLGGFYFKGWQAGYDPVVDYCFEKFQPICDASEVPCTLVDPRQDFKDNPGLIGWDGIHPTYNGSRRLAELIYEAMDL